MKPTTTLLPLLFSSFANAGFFGDRQKVLMGDAVPGANPLLYCEKNDNYSLTINKVDLSPNPPSPGKTLSIEAKGNFTQEVEKGAYINLVVKYGLIKLINQKTDLCDQMKEVDEECPLKGEKTIKKSVDLPKEIPPGKYNVLADVYTKDDDKITCLSASVHF